MFEEKKFLKTIIPFIIINILLYLLMQTSVNL